MKDSESSENVKVQLENGAVIRVESVDLGGRKKVGALDVLPFKEVTDAVEGIAGALIDSIKKVQPKKTTVEFGLEVGVESGNLTALLCKGTGKANLKIVLEWEGTEEKRNGQD